MRITRKYTAVALIWTVLLLLCACAPDSPPSTGSPSPSPTGDEVPSVLIESSLGYSVLCPGEGYEYHRHQDSDSFWHSVGIYLSVSLFPDTEADYVINGLRLQEDIEMEAEAAVVGAGQYPAHTLYYTDGQGNSRRFWVLERGADILLIEQSFPQDHPGTGLHRSVQQAILDSLTLS